MSFSRFLTILRARAGLIFWIMVAAGVAAGAVTMALPERYVATASVVVDPNVAQTSGNSALGSGRPDEFMSTHLDLVANPAVAARVIDTLGLERRPGIGALMAGSALMQNVRKVMAMVLETGEDETANDPRNWIADRLLRNLKVKTNRDSRLIQITYSAPDPEFAAAVANAFARGYLETLRRLQVEPAKEYAASFAEPIKALQRDLEAAEAKLAKFQQQKGIVATDERLDIETATLNDLSNQVAAAQSASYESQARQRQLRDFTASGGDAPAEVLASPVVQQLKQSVSDREAKLAEMSRRIGPNHPQYRAAVTELEGLKSQLSAQMRSAAQGLLSSGNVASQREGALRGALEQQRRRVLGLKNDRNQLAILSREVDGARQAYEAALARVTQTRTASQAGQTGGTVVDPAVAPTRPASPRPTLNIAVALAAGLLIGIGMALYRESVDGFVRSERDVVELLGAPVLAVLLPQGVRRDVRYLGSPNVRLLANRPG